MSPRSSFESPRIQRGLATVVLLGAALRFVPIWFGLPFDFARPDEETTIGHASAILAGDANPHFFHWPSLTFYVIAAVFRIASAIQWLLGRDPALSGNAQFITARAVVALAGTLTIVAVFALTREVAADATALCAAAFLAVAPLHVRESHFAMTDVLMTLFVTASIALLVRALRPAANVPAAEPSGTRWFAAAGIAGGLAASTKYSGAAVLASAGAAVYVLVRRREPDARAGQRWLPAVVFAIAFVFAFLAGTPYALLDLHAFASGFAFDVTHLSTGHALLDLGPGWTYHLERSLPYGLGPSIFVAAIVGAVVMARRYGAPAAIVGAFCATLYAAIGPGRTVFFRYVLPIVPFACLSAAVAVERAADLIGRRASKGVAIVVLTAGIALPALVNSAWLDFLLARTDTRVLAARWLAGRTTPDESLYDAGGVYAGVSLVGVDVHRWRVDTFDSARNTFNGSDGRFPDWLVLPESPLVYGTVPAGLRRLVERHYVLANTIRATLPGSSKGVYDLQDAFFMPIADFRGVVRPGPTVRIYRRVAVRD